MELLTDLQLFIDYEAHAVICCRKECQSALSIAGSHVTTHLREKHHVPEDARKGLTKILKSIPGLLSPTSFSLGKTDPLSIHIYALTMVSTATGGVTFVLPAFS
jgi:hypothetical protein